jgi:hypothetical protein
VVLGEPEPVERHRWLGAGVAPRRVTNGPRRHATPCGHVFGAIPACEVREGLEPVDPGAHEVVVDQSFFDDGGGHGVEHEDVRARSRLQVHVREVSKLDAARIDHDEPGARERGVLDPRADNYLLQRCCRRW